LGNNNLNSLKKSENVILDNTDRLKKDMIVMTAWGLGKIKGKNEVGQYIISIESNEVTFGIEDIKLNYIVYCCILCKEETYWTEVKLDFNTSLSSFKKKISSFVKCHPSQVVVIYGGKKLEGINNLEELGLYDKLTFLIAIKDIQEYSALRTKNIRTSNASLEFNAIRFKVNQDIIITALGFLKNKLIDVYYDLLIFEEISEGDLRLILSDKKILVIKDEFETLEAYKHKINSINIKENTIYQIHQYLSTSDNNQYCGIKGSASVDEKNTQVVFKFYNCELSGERKNSTTVEEGLIPSIYFYIKSE
jgi:hypothetical protein